VTELLVGQAIERIEDAALLTGQGRFADDLALAAGTGHAAFVRSPHAHANIVAIDTTAAEAMPGVYAILTGADVQAWSIPFITGVKQPMSHWCLAVDKARYAGEPVAIVIAQDRYRAEDAAEVVAVEYEPLTVIIDPVAAAQPGAPVLHDAVGSNVVHERDFSYGDPDAAFAQAAHCIAIDAPYPRNAGTPIECFVVTARYLPAAGEYDVLANFQGPFTLHPVMARALKISGTRLRLRTPPDSGGSFGVKQAVFPCIVALALAARKAGRPVHWAEDRLEHLTAATSATNRVTRIEAAFDKDGVVSALRYDQLDDCGAYLRAPEPATLYRMHGNLTGAYAIANLAIRNRVVLTNKTPSGLNRGFGGPQMYFALESIMRRIAETLSLHPLVVIRRNLVPKFPYRTASGALLDSGDYRAALDQGTRDGALDDLVARRTAMRAQGRLYGIGYAAVVEPSISNMGYITTLLTPEARAAAGPKNGAAATATVAIDPSGSVSVTVASTPQGQGHATVLAQIVGDALGLAVADIVVNVELDTQKDAWSIASGNYSSRFAGAVAGAAQRAALRVRAKLADIAAARLNVAARDLTFEGGQIFAAANSQNALSLRRAAGLTHWSPGLLPDQMAPGLRETEFWTMPELEAPDPQDRINSSGAYGFVFDFCGIEIDRESGRARIDRYVTTHDAGTRLNPALVDGQIYGGFAHGVGAALYEEFAYASDGGFLCGTFADYLVPTPSEIPLPIIVHRDTPSPFTPLGAKGVGEGNTMSTPVCIANAIADALDRDMIALPATPSRLAAFIHGPEDAPAHPAPAKDAPAKDASAGVTSTGDASAKGGLTGSGETVLPIAPQAVWDMLLDPVSLARVIPGCKALDRVGDNEYRAKLRLGVGPVRGQFDAHIVLSDLIEPKSLRLAGSATGPLGASSGSGSVRLSAVEGGTRIAYDYRVAIGGKVAAVGGRMLDGAARALIGQFFKRLAAQNTARPGLWRRLLGWLGIGS
jgi:2-furoyl-CoA dehydrogenase large subunit